MTNIVNFNGLTGPKLVAAYNEMLGQAVQAGVPGFKDARQVTRFATTEAGINRCEKLQEALRAHGTPATVPAEVAPVAAVTTFPETSVEDTNHTEDEDAEAIQPGETEEAYMARKAKKKVAGAAKKGAGKGKARSTGGTTIREMTEEYNAIVAKMTKAQKEAAPFAKHHTSHFESKEKASTQLTKLKKAIAKA